MSSSPLLPPDITAEDLHASLLADGEGELPFTIIDLLDNLPWFATGADWAQWRSFLKAIYGLGHTMTAIELQTFRECTGLKDPPEEQVREGYVACGRRARKSAVGALVGVYQAIRRDYRPFLAGGPTGETGERAGILAMSKDKGDAQQIFGYMKDILSCPAMSHHLLGDPLMERTMLQRRVDIIIRTANSMGGRVRACVGALLDEIAFWPKGDAANPDREVLRGILPSMAGKPDPMVLAMSSPLEKAGVLYEAYQELWGKPHPRKLFWKAPTIRMNPDPAVVVDVNIAYEEDAVSADSEFGANFRHGEHQYVDERILAECTVTGRVCLSPVLPTKIGLRDPEPVLFNYWAFVDTSGGSSDWMCVAIAHWDHIRKKLVLDDFRVWQPTTKGPFDPVDATDEASVFIRLWGLDFVTGDQYAGEWPPANFRKKGIRYNVSEKTKHEIYKDFIPAFNGRQCELLDVKVLFEQLRDLRRKVTPTGQERIDHQVGKKDDVANACCGALELADRIGRWQDPPKAPRGPVDTREALEQKLRDDAEGGASPWHDRFQY
jgi:hypothetical protein